MHKNTKKEIEGLNFLFGVVLDSGAVAQLASAKSVVGSHQVGVFPCAQLLELQI